MAELKNTTQILTWPCISNDPLGLPHCPHPIRTISSHSLLSLQTSNTPSFLHILNWWPFFTEKMKLVRIELSCPPTKTPNSLPAPHLEICFAAFLLLLLFLNNGRMTCAPLCSQSLHLGSGSDVFLPTQGLLSLPCH